MSPVPDMACKAVYQPLSTTFSVGDSDSSVELDDCSTRTTECHSRTSLDIVQSNDPNRSTLTDQFNGVDTTDKSDKSVDFKKSHSNETDAEISEVNHSNYDVSDQNEDKFIHNSEAYFNESYSTIPHTRSANSSISDVVLKVSQCYLNDSQQSESSNFSVSSHTPTRPFSRRLTSLYNSLVPSYKSKVEQFRRIFHATPVDTDHLLVDYSCALSKNNHGLLLQGRMYVTENWICFYSKIIYEQKIFLPVKEITAITKEKTARVIPNAIQIVFSKNGERFFFTSFAQRDRTYRILHKVWENCLNHQAMCIDDIMQQVRDIYGDDSLAMLEDEDSDSAVAAAPPLPTKASSTYGLTKTPDDDEGDHSKKDLVATTSDKLSDHELEYLSDQPMPSDKGNETSSICDIDTRRCQTPEPFSHNNDAYLGDNEDSKGVHSESSLSPHSNKVLQKAIRDKRKREHLGKSSMPRVSSLIDTKESHLPLLDKTSSPAACSPTHDHPGRLYVDTEIPMNVDALFTCLFTNSQFFAQLAASRSTFDIVQAQWPEFPWSASTETDKNNVAVDKIERTIMYTLTVKQKLGPRTSVTVEQQTILARETQPGRCYVIDAKVTNQGFPLCSCFHVVNRYCLLRTSNLSSHLYVSSIVNYDKPVFFGAKTILENTARSGLTDYFSTLTAQLIEQSSTLNDEERLNGGSLAAAPPIMLGKPEHDMVSSDIIVPEISEDLQSKRPNYETDVDMAKQIRSRASAAKVQPSLAGFPFNQGKMNVSATSVSNVAAQDTIMYDQNLGIIGRIFLRPDRAWLLLVLISLLLCICLSMVYNRLVALEKLAEHLSDNFKPEVYYLNYINGPFKPAAGISEELIRNRLKAIKEFSVAMMDTLTKMQHVLGGIKRTIEHMEKAMSGVVQETLINVTETTTAVPTFA